jgi:hypothetical protein
MRRLKVLTASALIASSLSGVAALPAFAASGGTTPPPATTTTTTTTPAGGMSIPILPTDVKALTSVLSNTATSLGEIGSTITVTLGSQYASSTNNTLLSLSGNNLEFNTTVWSETSASEQTQVLSTFIKNLQTSQVSPQDQQTIMTQLENSNSTVQQVLLPITMSGTSADLFSAMRIINPFMPIFRVLLGIGAIVIMLALMLSTVVDLVYIGIPIFQEKVNEMPSNGKGQVAGKRNKWFISHDAESVVRETGADTGAYQNPYLLYFKRRVFTWIILSICILYLVMGELGQVVAWLLHLGSGVLPQVGSTNG